MEPTDIEKPVGPRPGSKKKKIPADVGEYVKFTEITTAEESRTTTEQAGADGNQSTVTVEQQITDVEWEDIK